MSVEAVIIAKVVQDGDEALQYFIQQGVKGEYFQETKSRKAFDWLVEQWQEHGEVPTPQQFNRKFPTFKLFDVEDRLSALVDELRNHHAYGVAAEVMPVISKHFTAEEHEFDLDGVLEQVGDLQQRINVITAQSDVVIGSEFADAYVDTLINAPEGGFRGIPTGLRTLDELSGGWQPEQFVVWGAAPKRFKTTLLEYAARAAANAGYYVGVVSFEMSNAELIERDLCFGAKVSLNRIQRRELTKWDKDAIEDYVNELKRAEGEIVFIHDVNAATSLAGLTAQVKSMPRKLDALYIDGLYQMQDDTRKHDNETASLTAVSRGLKRLAAKLEIPVIGTTQMLLNRISKTQGSHMDSFGYTRAFAQDANVLMGIDRNDMTTNDIIVKVIAARSMIGVNLGVNVDYDRGEILETGEIDTNGDATDTYDNN